MFKMCSFWTAQERRSMKSYKIFKSSLKVGKLEKILNKLDSLGYEYVDMFMGKGWLFACIYVIAKTK